jgi:phage-related minor tail protein
MDEEIERLVVAVRADTAGFARDVAEMKRQLDGPLAQGVERAGRVLEDAWCGR